MEVFIYIIGSLDNVWHANNYERNNNKTTARSDLTMNLSILKSLKLLHIIASARHRSVVIVSSDGAMDCSEYILRGPEVSTHLPTFKLNTSVLDVFFECMKNNGNDIAQVWQRFYLFNITNSLLKFSVISNNKIGTIIILYFIWP